VNKRSSVRSGQNEQNLEFLGVQAARIGLTIIVKRTKSLRLGISEDEKVTLGSGKIDLLYSFSYIVVLLVKTAGSVKVLKVEWLRPKWFFHS